MCFSTEASFAASAVLLITGAASIRKVSKPSQLMFASIPIIFGIQQFAEGFLWLALTNVDYSHLQMLSTYTFLFFAQVIWPSWVPISFFFLEQNAKRKKILAAITAVGLTVSFYLSFRLISVDVESRIRGQYIHYNLFFTKNLALLSLIYIIPTVISPLIGG